MLGETFFIAHFLSLLLQNVMYVFRRTAFHTAHMFKHSKFCMSVLLIICPLALAQTQCWCVSRVWLGLTHLTLCSGISSISHFLSVMHLKNTYNLQWFGHIICYDYFSLSFAKKGHFYMFMVEGNLFYSSVFC